MTVLRRINIKYRRRHAVNWSLFKRDAHELRHGNLPSATSRICHELEKSCVDTSAGNRVLEPDNQLCHSRTFIKQNKNSESSSYSSSFTSEVELLFPPNTTNIIFIGKPFLFRQNLKQN